MKWLTVDYIRAHSRIDFNCEDELLSVYGEAAEDTVLDVCNTAYDDLIAEYGSIPARLVQASLMLVDHWYQNRSVASSQNLYSVPYTFELLVKPFMKLV